MITYTPDKWVCITVPFGHKILCGDAGSYLYGQSWRMNSGVKGVSEHGDSYYVEGFSGSLYDCRKNSYGMNIESASVLSQLSQKSPDVKMLTFEETIAYFEKLMNEKDIDIDS
jgi:hypothetical protein